MMRGERRNHNTEGELLNKVEDCITEKEDGDVKREDSTSVHPLAKYFLSFKINVNCELASSSLQRKDLYEGRIFIKLLWL